MTTAWPAVPLNEVAVINPRPGSKLHHDDKVAFIPMAAVDAVTGAVDSGEIRTYGELSAGLTPFESGDLLVAKITPCFENGKIAQAQIRTRVAFGSTEFHIVRARPDAADQRYLFHFLRQGWIRRAGERRMTGSAGQRRVPEAFLRDIPIPLPPVEEQRRIAAILDAADELRAKRRRSLALLDSLTASIFLHIFGDPVTNSMGWDSTVLGSLGTLDRGMSKHRPRNAPELLGGPYPLVQTGDVANSGGYITRYSSTYSEIGLRQSRMWPAGTLCITIAANIAKTGLLTFEACFPDSIVGFTSPVPGMNEYVRSLMGFHQHRLERLAPESAQKNINLKVLRELRVPAPPNDVVYRFAEAVRTARVEKRCLTASESGLDSLFAALQHRAFRGEL